MGSNINVGSGTSGGTEMSEVFEIDWDSEDLSGAIDAAIAVGFQVKNADGTNATGVYNLSLMTWAGIEPAAFTLWKLLSEPTTFGPTLTASTAGSIVTVASVGSFAGATSGTAEIPIFTTDANGRWTGTFEYNGGISLTLAAYSFSGPSSAIAPVKVPPIKLVVS